jgi:hypothetical protein
VKAVDKVSNTKRSKEPNQDLYMGSGLFVDNLETFDEKLQKTGHTIFTLIC